MRYGGFPHGAVETFGAGNSTPAPKVSVSTPSGTDSSGGPDLEVSWTSINPWGLGSSCFSVVVLNSGVVEYDSGILAGAPGSFVIPNAVSTLSSSIPLLVVVSVGVGPIGAPTMGSASSPFTLDWGAPGVSFVPGSRLETDPFIDLEWVYAGTPGQGEYQVEVRTNLGIPVWQSGWITSAATSTQVAAALPNGVWEVFLTVRNTFGVPSVTISDSWTIQTATSPSSSVAPNELVGVTAEVGVQGIPLMLYDNREERQDWRWQRRVAPLDAPRFASGDTPFNESFDRYSFVGQSEWDGGQGQTWHQREGSDDSAFNASWHVDTFSDPREIVLAESMTPYLSVVAGTSVTTASGKLFWLDEDLNLWSLTSWASSPSLVDAGVGAGASLISNGVEVFVVEGTQVRSGNTSLTTYSSEPASLAVWAADRLCVAYPSSGSAPNVFNTVGPGGTREVVSGRLVLPPGTSITSISGEGAWVFFTADAYGRSAVYAWKAGSDDAPVQAAAMPEGERAVEVFAYQSQVFIRSEGSDGGGTFWRGAVGADGTLSLFLLLEGMVAGGRGMIAEGQLVLFGWAEMGPAGEDGIGAVNLATNGVQRWRDTLASGHVSGVARWRGHTVVLAGGGLYRETGALEEAGWLRTSWWDGGGSTLDKIWDEMRVTTEPLPIGCSVNISVTHDGASFVQTGSLIEGGRQFGAWEVDTTTRRAALQIELSGTGSSSPSVLTAQLKMHPQGVSDVVLQLPVACFDETIGLNGQILEILPGGHGSGSRLMRLLESYTGELVLIQDVDWVSGQPGEVFELLGAESQKVSIYDRHAGRQGVGFVTTLALRRPV